MVGCKKVAGGPLQSGFFGRGDGILDLGEFFIRPGSDLDKDDAAVMIDHDQVYLAGPAGKISREDFEAFAFEELFAAFLAPPAEQPAVGQKPASVDEQISDEVYRFSYPAILIRYVRCAAEPA
jgi:hypothetical protein